MAVSTTATRVSFSGNGSTTDFAWPYEYRVSADLKVVLVTAANVATLKTLTTHYTIAGVSDAHGGFASATVTMITAPASGETLVIYRSPSPVQAADVESESDPLYALNNALDLSTYVSQALYNDALKLPIGVTESFSNTLPDLPDDDGTVYYFGPNAARTAFSWLALTTGSVVVSSAMSAVVTSASLGAGRTAFAVPGLADANTFTAANVFTLAGLTATFTNTDPGASSQVAIFESDSASPADNDVAYISLRMSDSAGNQDEFARLSWLAADRATTSEDAQLILGVIIAGTLTNKVRLEGSALSPHANDGTALGTTALGWSDIHLASGAVINIANGLVTITHDATLDELAVAAGAFRARSPLSTETTGTLTAANSANAKIIATGGITIPASVFAAGDSIYIDGGGTARTITRGAGLAMYIAGTDSATGTLTANGVMGVHFRTTTVCILSGNVS